MRSKFLAQALILTILANGLTGCAVKRWWNYHFGPRGDKGTSVAPLPGQGDGIGMSPRGPIGEGDHGTFAAQTIHFDYDSAKIKPSEVHKLEDVASGLKGNSKNLIVEGHTDERGTAEYNRALGEKRAQAAREELVRMGVSASRITTISYGKDRPVEASHDDTAYSANRRAEFVVVNQ